MHRRKIVILSIIILISASLTFAHAYKSTNYTLVNPRILSSGGKTSSANYSLSDVEIGNIIGGTITSTNYSLETYPIEKRIPPSLPTVDPVTSPTNNPTQTLSGTKDKATSIYINGYERVPLDSETTWSYPVELVEGENYLIITSRNIHNLESNSVTAYILLDTSAPFTPVVTDDGEYTTSLTQLHAIWTCHDPETSIIEYQYSIGTSPDETDIVDWTSANTDTEVTHKDLTLEHAKAYYFNVKAKNGVQVWSKVASSDGITVNEHAPVINNITPQDNSTFSAGTEVTITIDARDPDNDPLEYQFLVNDNVEQSWSASSTYEWTALPTTSLIRKITCQVRDDKGGQISQSINYNIEIDATDTTPPTTPVVTTDEYSNSLTSLSASWYSLDPESGIAEFRYAIGTTEGSTDIVDWTSAGTNTGVTHYGLELVEGKYYYFSVKATNGVGLTGNEGYSSPANASKEVTIRITSPQDNSIITSNEFTIKGIVKGTDAIKINDKDVFVNPDGTFTGPILIAPGKAARMEAEGKDLTNYIIMSYASYPTTITASSDYGQSHEIDVYYYQLPVELTEESYSRWIGYTAGYKTQCWNMNILAGSPFEEWSDSSCNYRRILYGWDREEGEWVETSRKYFTSTDGGIHSSYRKSTIIVNPTMGRGKSTTDLTIHTLPQIEGKKTPMFLIFKNCRFIELEPEHSPYLPSLKLSEYTANGHPLQHLYGELTQSNAFYIILNDYEPNANIALTMKIPYHEVGADFEGFSCSSIDLLMVEMTAYRPQTTPFKWWTYTIPDKKEEDSGAGIRINGDNDLVTGEDDLIMVTLEVATVPAPAGLEYVLKRSNSNIKVWESPSKGTAILDEDEDNEQILTFDDENQKTVWVENPNGGTAYLELQARVIQNQRVILKDRIRFYPFTSVTTIFGGEFQNPTDPPPPGAGIYTLGKDLYLDGYDVHMYEEPDIGDSPNAEEEALNEINSAVNKRNVNSIAIMGYSHGGGSTYNISEDLPAAYNLIFTAYIDAISQPFAMAETRMPRNSAYHVNYYQVGVADPISPYFDWELDGGPVPGAENHNLEDDGQQTITHGGIDDSAVVLNGISDRFIEEVNK